MTYRLAFIRTNDGYLEITASLGTQSFTAININPGVLDLFADVAARDIEDPKRTAEEARVEKGLIVCCEDIELDSDRFKNLRFEEAWRRLLD